MQAVYIKDFGGPENLVLREVPDPPEPAGSEVLIRVRAAGLNRADLLQRRGFYPAPPGTNSHIPGLEFAGEVVRTGNSVTTALTGDRVFGITAGEAQAEYLLIDERLLAPIPENLSFTEAAAVPEAFVTAHDAIFTQGRLQRGETLMIHAVGSGVGLAALQLAKAAGARVIGTSRTADKLERCKAFGLDHGILTADGPKFADAARAASEGGVDVILDLVGGGYFSQNIESLEVKGRLILVGLTAGAQAEFNLAQALSKRLSIIGTVLRGRSLEEKADATAKFRSEVVPLLRSGKVSPVIDRVFPAKEIRAAHEYLESNESFGKVVIEL